MGVRHLLFGLFEITLAVNGIVPCQIGLAKLFCQMLRLIKKSESALFDDTPRLCVEVIMRDKNKICRQILKQICLYAPHCLRHQSLSPVRLCKDIADFAGLQVRVRILLGRE